ncbi:hypothetical protein Vafri_4061 [Volvox africanus]|uniref:Uncharacterized protein n=1 Tax=Volvox africanus TaxID=51714 RepID=A0A8J4AXH3_9CHLO|nr:hypothetical protein Vafri_4061 [Volvox africanus]
MLTRLRYLSVPQFVRQALGVADNVYQQYRNRYPPILEVFRTMHFGAAMTNALASRPSPAAVCVLPATAVTAVASRHGARFQPSSCTNCFCSRCSSVACAASAPQTCSSSKGSSTSTSTSSSGCRVRGLTAAVRNPLRTSASLPTATASLPARDSPTMGVASAICDPSAYQSLSLLILLHECTRRAYGRPLLETEDLLSLPAQMDSLPCCVVLLGPEDSTQPLQHGAPGSPSAPASASPPNVERSASMPASAVATATSVGVSGNTEHLGEEDRLGTPSLGISTAAVGSSCSNNSSSDCSSSGSGTRSRAGELLRVQYLNRAAAEALKVRANVRSESSALWVEVAGLDVVTLRTMHRARGSPQKGEVRAVKLTLMSAPASRQSGSYGVCGVCGGSASAGAEEQTIDCPEALLLPLMSPNGTCAGVAVMFEKWEVRGRTGRVELEGRPLVPEVPPDSPLGEVVVSQLQERVRAQADEVRKLKTQQGLTNKDPLVVAAVVTLQQLKAELDLQERLNQAFGGSVSMLRPLQLQQQQQQQ